MPDRQHWCPVCNSQVRVVSYRESTSHYQSAACDPVSCSIAAELQVVRAERDMVRIATDKLAAECDQMRADLERLQKRQGVLDAGGCHCDPPLSGEEYCTGHCALRAEITELRASQRASQRVEL